MLALDVLRQIKLERRAQQSTVKFIEWGNAEYIKGIGIDNLTRREIRKRTIYCELKLIKEKGVQYI